MCNPKGHTVVKSQVQVQAMATAFMLEAENKLSCVHEILAFIKDPQVTYINW